jgi:hypothetical protein
MESETGWWLITHPDHARLAGAFATAWGNERFRRPEPRARVLRAISEHDDGWIARDAQPTITKQGKPSAFSTELVGKYSAFEEIDIEEYLAVRERAVRNLAGEDSYAGLLVLMHTYNLLTEHADRSTIAPEGLALLDRFLESLRGYRQALMVDIAEDATLVWPQMLKEMIEEHFRLLQACDNLSLLSCVAYEKPAHLLHPLPLNDGGAAEIQVEPLAARHFRLSPWPFAEPELRFEFPARHVQGKLFNAACDLEAAFRASPVQQLSVTLTA